MRTTKQRIDDMRKTLDAAELNQDLHTAPHNAADAVIGYRALLDIIMTQQFEIEALKARLNA